MIEVLAEEIHKMWMCWAKELMQQENFSVSRIRRWKKCFVPYNQLSERMKELDRRIARKLIKLIKKGIII